MLDMKHLIRIISLIIGLTTAFEPASAQTPYILHIDSIVGLPDTIADGDEMTFFMTVSMSSPLFYQGDVFVDLEYGGSLHAVDTSISANSFLGPNVPNTVQASHRLSTDDDLNIGDNVVVVWPRIGNGTTPPQEVSNPYETVITLVEPSGIDENTLKHTPLFHPNPANNSIRLSKSMINSTWSINVSDMQGRTVISAINSPSLDVSQLPVGVYLVQVQTDDGSLHTDRLFVTR